MLCTSIVAPCLAVLRYKGNLREDFSDKIGIKEGHGIPFCNEFQAHIALAIVHPTAAARRILHQMLKTKLWPQATLD